MNADGPEDFAGRRADAVVEDAELRALFAPRRPDAAAFARGVAARLQRDELRPRRPSRAAEILPFDVTAFGYGKLSLLTGSAWWLAALAAMFAFVGRSLRRSAGLAASTTQRTSFAYPYAAESLLLYLVASTITGIALWFGGRVLQDLLLLVLFATIACYAVCARAAARAGLASRAHVAGLSLHVLEFLLVFGLAWHFDLPIVGDAQWSWLGMPIVLVGIAALLPLVTRLNLIGAVVVAAPLAVWLAVTDARPMTRQPLAGSLADAVATTAVRADAVDEWVALPHLVEAARASGEAVSVPATVRAAVDTAVAEATPVEAMALHCAARLALFDDDDWRRVAALPRHGFALRRLLDRDGPLRPSAWQEHELEMLRATGGLEAARDRIAQRLIAGGFDPTDLQPMQTAAIAVHWLQRLGRDDAIAGLRPRLHDLLAGLHRSGSFGTGGGFAPHRGTPFSTREATHDAVFLLRQVGAPTAIDLPALHRHLVREGGDLPNHDRGVRVRALSAFADRVLLEQSLGTPRRGPWRTLLEERNVVALAAIALLCVSAAWCWPRQRASPAIAMP